MLLSVSSKVFLSLSVLAFQAAVGQDVMLNASFSIEGKSKCSDPLLPMLLSDSSKKYYGCCAIKPSDAKEGQTVCCLLAGSYCDPFGKNGPPPCKGAACCGKDGSAKLGVSKVRWTAGTVFDPNLRQRDYTSIVFSPDRDPKVVLDEDSRFGIPCQDPKRKKNKAASYHGLRLEGCCTKEPTTPQETASDCCLFSGSACDGTIPCCNNMACDVGKCPADVGYLTDADLSGFCRYSDYSKSQPVNASATPFDQAQKADACKSTALPMGYNLTATGALACCKSGASITSAQAAQKNCCLQSKSPCDNTIDCCSGMPCCAGVCQGNSGNRFGTKIITFPKAIC